MDLQHQHDHNSPSSSNDDVYALGWIAFDALVVLLLVAAAAGYALALWAARSRGRWPIGRVMAWYAGLLCIGVGLVGPIAAAARATFTAHMTGHLLIGMAAPLLLVLAAPLTLALRALTVRRAQVLTRFLRSPPLRFITHPTVAGGLNAGGLWVLYTTDLYSLMHTSVLLHGAVHMHIFLAGYLFVAALIGPDPNPHRASIQMRSVVLIAFIAAHSILAKWLYVHPPAGVEISDGRTGAQLMYYGGDIIDITLIVLLLAGWFRATQPRVARPG